MRRSRRFLAAVVWCSVVVWGAGCRNRTPPPCPGVETLSIEVEADTVKFGFLNIGHIHVEAHQEGGANCPSGPRILADFRFTTGYEPLDQHNDFRWMSVIETVYANGSSVPTLQALGDLPALDAGSSEQPFFYEESVWLSGVVGSQQDQIHEEFARSRFIKVPSVPAGVPSGVDVIADVKTYLVAVDPTFDYYPCVLKGFHWKFFRNGSGEQVQLVGELPGDDALIDQALFNAVNSGSYITNYGPYNPTPGPWCSPPLYKQSNKSGKRAYCDGGSYSLAGTSVDGGDMDGDGLPDIAVGVPYDYAPGASNTGKVVVRRGTDDMVIHELTGSSALDAFGASVAILGDVDLDGHDDLAVGAPQSDWAGSAQGPGYVHVYSGQTGSLLYQSTGSAPGGLYGFRVAAAGDQDQDGIPDLLIGAPGAGMVAVMSGATGAIVHQITHPGTGTDFGWSLAAGDVDWDGVPDTIVGAPGLNVGTAGQVRVYSGATGHIVTTLNGPAGFGFSVAHLTDGVTGAGLIAVGDPGALGSAGSVTLYSAGAVVATLVGDAPNDHLGASVVAASDYDGDGWSDLAVGAPQARPDGAVFGPGYVEVRSGNGWATIERLRGENAGDAFGLAIARVGDMDNDGFSELAIGAPLSAKSGFSAGAVHVFCFAQPGLELVDPLVPGSQATLRIRSAAESGLTYVCAFSASGSVPGIPLPDGRVVPLNIDAITLLSLEPNNGMFLGTVGLLDGLGTATVSINVPNAVALSGFGLQCAFIVFDPSTTSGIGTVSDALNLVVQ